ncbi:MAG: hypothetical protein ACRD03_13570 [Acidimicrobiales bacterium]
MATRHWLLVAAVASGTAARVVFWMMTDRRFEDGLITVTHAQSLFEGIGLTHHAGEPRVQHGFTSALSVLVPLVGEAVRRGAGLNAVRLASIGAFAVASLYAYLLARGLGLGRAPTALVLFYLAFDFNQIFYGMAGMETQIAVAILLGAIHHVGRGDRKASGVLLGLCILVRPDFVIFVVPALGFLAWRHRDRLLPAVAIAAACAFPWVAFATLYYGSPVPATIDAKANRYVALPELAAGPGAWLSFAVERVEEQTGFWRIAAPFKENGFVNRAPVADIVLANIAVAVFVLALCGAWSLRRRPDCWPAIAFCLLFVVYKVLLLPAVYYEWYLPPFMAVVILLAATALQRFASFAQRGAPAVAIGLTAAYAVHLPFTFPIERRIQLGIEDRVRREVGSWLAANVEPGESVTSESAGYVGYYGRVKLFDYPGLTSPTVLDALGERPDRRTLEGVVELLRPDWVVLRPFELDTLQATFPDTAARYVEVRRFGVEEADTPLVRWKVEYGNIDRQFVVLRRDAARRAGARSSAGPHPAQLGGGGRRDGQSDRPRPGDPQPLGRPGTEREGARGAGDAGAAP